MPAWVGLQFLRREFDTNVRDVQTTMEIAAIEAATLQRESGGGAPPRNSQKMGSSHLNEIWPGSTPAIRRKIWDKLFDGKAQPQQATKQSALKLKSANSDAGKIKLKASAPPKAPRRSQAAHSGQAEAGGKVMSISKWTAVWHTTRRTYGSGAELSGWQRPSNGPFAAINGAEEGILEWQS